MRSVSRYDIKSNSFETETSPVTMELFSCKGSVYIDHTVYYNNDWDGHLRSYNILDQTDQDLSIPRVRKLSVSK